MRRNTAYRIAGFAILISVTQADAQVSPVTYQGRLNASGQPYSGAADIQVSLFDALQNGQLLGQTLDLPNVAVVDGLFTIELPIPNALLQDGNDRWVEIAVRTRRQRRIHHARATLKRITHAPYAAHTRGLAVDDNGRLGVGTNNPVASLNVFGANDSNGTAWFESPKGVNRSHIHFGGDGDWYIRSATGAGKVILQDAGGNVGIGTNSPTLGKLDVRSASQNNAVYGQAFGASGVDLEETTPAGVWGDAEIGVGVRGTSNGTIGFGAGVYGASFGPWGYGVYGVSSGANAAGVYGETTDSSGYGVWGYATAESGVAHGVVGESNSVDGAGVYGINTADSATAYGVHGISDEGIGVSGESDGNDGVRGTTNDPEGAGVRGIARFATGSGVKGEASVEEGRGVYGVFNNNLGQSGYGVYGSTNSPAGFAGYFDGKTVINGKLGIGTSSPTNGELDVRVPAGAQGIYAQVGGTATGVGFGGGIAVWGDSATGNGVLGTASSNGGAGLAGLTGAADNGFGVYGFAVSGSGTNYAVYGETNSPDSYAGYFFGNVHVNGTLSKGAGSFKIDHPLDPENKYLYHSFVESPDMKNIYDGVVTTDERGYATVTMPDWFDALNRDFRYQLTVVDDCDGADYPWAKVVRKMQGNQFTLRTNRPNIEVSWQVTGIREDKFAEAHRIPIEEVKKGQERGHYLHAKEHGQPVEKGLDHARRQSRSQTETTSATTR